MSPEPTPVVTVVIPTRDRPQLLRRAIEGVFAQDLDGEIECLVVFDGTEPALPDVTPPPGFTLRAITNERKPGLAGARNTGVLTARGTFLAQCDDDDEWLPGKLAPQVRALEADPSLSAATTGIEVRYEDRSFERIAPDDLLRFEDLLASRRLDAHPSSFLFRRADLLDGIGLVDEELPGGYAEDYELLLRAARRGPIRTIREPLVRVHWHATSFFEGRWRMIADALRHLLRAYPEFASVPSGYARIGGQIAFAQAASGDRRDAVRWAGRTLRANWREPRAALALGVAAGVAPGFVVRTLHRVGKGL